MHGTHFLPFTILQQFLFEIFYISGICRLWLIKLKCNSKTKEKRILRDKGRGKKWAMYTDMCV